MDWSLVLASQDIENTIEEAPDQASWGLIVAEKDYSRALSTLEAYQEENRHWRWRRQVLRGGMLFDWASLLWVVLLVVFYTISAEHSSLTTRGLMDAVPLSQGEFWRLFTAIWLHADLGHLATNAALGMLLLGLTLGRYGSGTGLLAAYLAGAGGNLAVAALALGHSSLGASGMVMGCLGLLSSGTLRWNRRRTFPLKSRFRSALGGVLLFVLLGLSPDTDFRAHIGGFVTGLGLGALLSAYPRIERNSTINLAAALGFTTLVILPWWMAFRLHP